MEINGVRVPAIFLCWLHERKRLSLWDLLMQKPSRLAEGVQKYVPFPPVCSLACMDFLITACLIALVNMNIIPFTFFWTLFFSFSIKLCLLSERHLHIFF